MWICEYVRGRNHTASREFLSRVIFQKKLKNMGSALAVCVAYGSPEQSRALPCVLGEVSDSSLLLPVLLPGKSMSLPAMGWVGLQKCGLSLSCDGEFALWAIIR